MNKRNNLKLLYLTYAILGFTVPIFDPLYPYFSTNFNIGYDKIGLVFFAGSLVAIVFSIIAGRICDRYSFRIVLLFSFLVTCLGFTFFAIFQGFLPLIITVLFVNLGYSFVWPGAYSAVFTDFRDNYSIIYVNLDKFYYFSTLFGPLIMSVMLYFKLSPRLIFVFLSISFGVMYIMFYFNFKVEDSKVNGKRERIEKKRNRLNIIFFKSRTCLNNNSSDSLYLKAGNLEISKEFLKDFGIKENAISINTSNNINNIDDDLECSYGYPGFKNIFKVNTILSGIALTLFSCVMVGSSAWLTTYFTFFNIPIFLSSIFVSIYWFFTFIGLEIVSKILKRLGEERILFYGGILSSISLIFYGLIPNIFIKIIFIALTAMGISGIYPLASSISVRENPQAPATASGFIVAMGIVGNLIIQPTLGFFVEYYDKQYIPFILCAFSVLGSIVAGILNFSTLNLQKNKFK